MRYFTVMAFLFVAGVARAAVLSTGYYQFESNPDVTILSGNWYTYAPISNQYYYTTDINASLSFQFSGQFLLIYRLVGYSYLNGNMQVCINSSCSLITNTASIIDAQYPASFDAGSVGTHTVTITNISSPYLYLDSFLVMSSYIPAPGGGSGGTFSGLANAQDGLTYAFGVMFFAMILASYRFYWQATIYAIIMIVTPFYSASIDMVWLFYASFFSVGLVYLAGVYHASRAGV